MTRTTDPGRHTTLYSILAVALLIWGAFGALDITKQPYTGYTLSADNIVTQVRPGGPLAAAGLKVGDTVTQIDGRPVESVAAFFERGRPAIGSQGSLAITRGGTAQTLTFTYAEQPTSDLLAGSGINVVIGLAFVILGLAVYLKRQTRLSSLLCAVSLMLGFLYLPAPFLAAAGLRQVATALIQFVVGVALATLLYYCLSFPRTKELLASRPWLRLAIFILAPLVGLIFAFIDLTTPDVSASNSMVLSYLAGVVYGGYVLLAIVAVIVSAVKASTAERSTAGLNLILLGILIGWGPLVISILYHTLVPYAGDLPGERFWGITAIALPIGMSLALMRLERGPSAART